MNDFGHIGRNIISNTSIILNKFNTVSNNIDESDHRLLSYYLIDLRLRNHGTTHHTC